MERSRIDGGRAVVGIAATEGERAGAGLGEAPCARNAAGEGGAGGGVCGEGEAAEAKRARPSDGSEVLIGPEGQRAGVDGGGAGVGVRAGDGEGSSARLGEAAAGTGEDAGEARGGVVSADADGVGSEIQAVAALDGTDVVGVGASHAEGHRLRPGGAGIERGVLEGVYIREFERGAAVDRRGAGVGIRHAKPHHAAGRGR